MEPVDLLALASLEMSSTTVTLALLAVFLVLLYWYSTSAFSKLSKVGIQHPPPLPFIGNLLFFREGFWESHTKLITEYGPVCGYYIGRQMFVVVSSPEMIKQILVTDFSNFTNRIKPNLVSKPMLDSILCLRDDRWKYVRSLLTPAFSDTKLKEMTPLINQACDILLCNLKVYADSGKAFDIQRCYNCFTLDVVGSVAFGTEVDSQKNPDDPFVKNCRTFFEMSLFKPLFILILSFPFIMIPLLRIFPTKKQKELNGFFIQTIKNAIVYRHQQDAAERRRDFLQWMLDACDSADSLAAGCWDVPGPSAALRQDEAPPAGTAPSEKAQKMLTEDEIAGQAFLFLIAGYETTTSTLSFATYLLATNPECQEKVLWEVDEFFAKHMVPDYQNVQELPYLDMVIAETLRMYPPAFRIDIMWPVEGKLDNSGISNAHFYSELSKVASSPFFTSPKMVPDYQNVQELPYLDMVIAETLRMYPPAFRFTEEAKKERHPFAYLPFGAGPRGCIGMKMGLLETKMTLLRILQKFQFKACPETEIPLQLKSKATLGPKNGVYIMLESR
ncbi:thromboxane-A synthase [Cyanistes caeruleus]|uniref:thromboxane-A synthase n=1 Tax=Cyanistes caeruleus TaxID=156563 RepID=UPI000CDB3E7F|nr:thromboxane-A synthase [Cyanistes caeruleus]